MLYEWICDNFGLSESSVWILNIGDFGVSLNPAMFISLIIFDLFLFSVVLLGVDYYRFFRSLLGFGNRKKGGK